MLELLEKRKTPISAVGLVVKSELSELKLSGRLALIGVGNENHGDDGAGLEVVRRLDERIDSSSVLLVEAEAVPENFTSKIKKFGPDCIVIFDSVELGRKDGEVSDVDRNEIVDMSSSTHRLPLSKLMDYLEEETGAETHLIGIQPSERNRDGLTDSVERSVSSLVKFFADRITL